LYSTVRKRVGDLVENNYKDDIGNEEEINHNFSELGFLGSSFYYWNSILFF